MKSPEALLHSHIFFLSSCKRELFSLHVVNQAKLLWHLTLAVTNAVFSYIISNMVKLIKIIITNVQTNGQETSNPNVCVVPFIDRPCLLIGVLLSVVVRRSDKG